MNNILLILTILFQNLPQPPVNWIYAGLLSLIALLLAIVGWFLKMGHNDFRAWQKTTDVRLQRLDNRLVRIETKLEIEHEPIE